MSTEKLTPERIAERVKKIVSENLGRPEAEITDSSRFIDDLGADSLDTMELVMSFEEAFNCQINDDQAAKIQTVQDAVNYINDHIGDATNA